MIWPALMAGIVLPASTVTRVVSLLPVICCLSLAITTSAVQMIATPRNAMTLVKGCLRTPEHATLTGSKETRAIRHAVVANDVSEANPEHGAYSAPTRVNPLESVTLEVSFPTRPSGRAHGIARDGHASHGPSNRTHEQIMRHLWRCRDRLSGSIIRPRAAAESRQANPPTMEPRRC
jgi:hypothetical protein